MPKPESNLRNMFLALTLIAMLMSGALSFVYLKTKDLIARTDQVKREKAIREAIPPFDSLAVIKEPVSEGDTLTASLGFAGDTLTGIVVETYTTKGFSGLIKFVVGFTPDGRINNLTGFAHKETPGLGTKMSEPKFRNQFLGKNPETFKLKVKKDGGDVDAISAATITSRAVCDGISKAWVVFGKIRKGLQPHEVDSVSATTHTGEMTKQ